MLRACGARDGGSRVGPRPLWAQVPHGRAIPWGHGLGAWWWVLGASLRSHPPCVAVCSRALPHAVRCEQGEHLQNPGARRCSETLPGTPKPPWVLPAFLGQKPRRPHQRQRWAVVGRREPFASLHPSGYTIRARPGLQLGGFNWKKGKDADEMSVATWKKRPGEESSTVTMAEWPSPLLLAVRPTGPQPKATASTRGAA